MHSFLSYSLVLLAPLTLIFHLSLYLTSISLSVVSFITHCLSPSSLSFPLILTLYTKEISVEAKWYEDFCLICLPMALSTASPSHLFSSCAFLFFSWWFFFCPLTGLFLPLSLTPCSQFINSCALPLPPNNNIWTSLFSPFAVSHLLPSCFVYPLRHLFFKSSTLQLSTFPPVTISWICAAPWVWI